jgi:hypothetical protein
MALSLAHALELPGKLRLPKEQYLVTQPIYYPGFTIGGAAEPIGLVLALVLLIVTPFGSAPFWLTAAAVAALAAMHVIYWVMTHPVNNFWLREAKLEGVGAGFFRFDPLARHSSDGTPDWIRLRNRWEFSHVIRACLGLASLVLLVTAVAA